MLSLYPWQQRALRAWITVSFQGVVEAVTGVGKSRLAVAAIEMELRRGGRAAVLVHTKELLAQWRGQLARLLPLCGHQVAIGTLGQGEQDTLQTHRVVVAMAQSAANSYILGPLVSSPALLVVDEVHHYAAASWQLGLETKFERRLGLTATYERDDSGIEEVLDPYFGGVCMSVDYEEALAEEVIADFKVAFVGVPFTPEELDGYQQASHKIGKYKGKLVGEYGLSGQDEGQFMAQAAKLAASKSGEGARLAGFYLSAVTQRRSVIAGAAWKQVKLQALAPAIRAADRTILFTQTKEAANNSIAWLRAANVSGAVMDSAMSVDQRAEVFAAFEAGEHEVVAAPQLLDEGIDVPSADLAIVLASSRSRRQMVQRMGRVLRKKPDGRMARVCVLFVEDSFEDPDKGAHATFTESIQQAAADVQVFRRGTPDLEIVNWLSP